MILLQNHVIRYTPAKQLTLEGFSTPFSLQLSTTNRWVVLAAKIPWDKLADVYYKKMRADFGAPTLSARMVIGAVMNQMREDLGFWID
jgi:hypothetical protein